MKQKATDDARAIRGQRPKQKSGNVVRSETDHQIRKAKLAFVANLFFFAQAREGRAIRCSGLRESKSPFAMGNPIIPSEVRTSRLLEIGNDFTKFGMNAAAVVALVVVLHQDLPVCGDIVGDAVAGSQFREGIARNSLDRRAQLGAEVASFGRCVLRIQVQEEKATPGIHADGIK